MRVECDSVAPVSPGGWAILRVTSINDDTGAVAWPIRLHPHESTVSFIVDGVRHRGAEQIDSIVETVMLAPGEALSTGVLVSSSDRGPILPTVASVQMQLAVQPPGSDVEVLSNMCVVEVELDHDDGAGRSLRELDRLAWSARDGDLADPSAVGEALAAFAEQDRAWVTTALLPPAPLDDDVLLIAANKLTAVHAVSGDEPDDDRLARAVLEGLPYPHNKTR